MGHIKISKISKETPKDVPETSYGPYRHYRCGGTERWTDEGGGVGGRGDRPTVTSLTNLLKLLKVTD